MGARSQATESTGEVLSPDQELGVRGDRTFMSIQVLLFKKKKKKPPKNFFKNVDYSSNEGSHIQVSFHTSQSL